MSKINKKVLIIHLFPEGQKCGLQSTQDHPWEVLWFGCQVFHIGSYVWTHNPQLVRLFDNIVKTFGHGS